MQYNQAFNEPKTNLLITRNRFALYGLIQQNIKRILKTIQNVKQVQSFNTKVVIKYEALFKHFACA